MTITQFNNLKCGDTVHLQKLGRNTPSASGPAEKINRTYKLIMPFGINKFYHYTKVNLGYGKGGIWGHCYTTMIVESLETDNIKKKATENKFIAI
jgi:hypothetical protein